MDPKMRSRHVIPPQKLKPKHKLQLKLPVRQQLPSKDHAQQKMSDSPPSGLISSNMPSTDTAPANELLRKYQASRSEEAFRELVHRYIDFVYGIACRKLQTNDGSADDVVQTVFSDLARMAPRLSASAPLGGWLHKHTTFTAAKHLRSERRRQVRERLAMEMETLHHDSAAHWEQLSPVLDDAIAQLRDRDRDLIVLRFFENKRLRAIGTTLGITEDAAQKRLSRALERLKRILTKRGYAGTTAAALATTLQDHAASTTAPIEMSASVATSAWSSTTTTTLSSSSPFILMTKAQAAAFGGIVLLSTIATVPLAREVSPGQPLVPASAAGTLAGRKPSSPILQMRSQPDALRHWWVTERLINTDPERALQICLDGESTDRRLWEALLQNLLPDRVEDAIGLVIRGRCFRSPDVRADAMEILFDRLPLEVLVDQAAAISRSAGPGVQSLLEHLVRRWALTDAESARQLALDLPNVLRRQHALAAALAAASDVGSESWTLAFEQLSPALSAKAIEPIFKTGSVESRIAWLNDHMAKSHHWNELIMRAFKDASEPREAWEIATREGIMEDKSLQKQMAQWAAQEDTELYLEYFSNAPTESSRSLRMRHGLRDLMQSAPHQALQLVSDNPQLIDPWSMSILCLEARSPEHLDRIRTLLDATPELQSHYMTVTNYLHAMASHAPSQFMAAWEDLSSSAYKDHGRARNIGEIVVKLWTHPEQSAVAREWIASMNEEDADAAYLGMATSHLLERSLRLEMADRIQDREMRQRALNVLNR